MQSRDDAFSFVKNGVHSWLTENPRAKLPEINSELEPGYFC